MRCRLRRRPARSSLCPAATSVSNVTSWTETIGLDYRRSSPATCPRSTLSTCSLTRSSRRAPARRERGVAGRLVHVDPWLKCLRSSDYAGSLSWNDPQASRCRGAKLVQRYRTGVVCRKVDHQALVIVWQGECLERQPQLTDLGMIHSLDAVSSRSARRRGKPTRERVTGEYVKLTGERGEVCVFGLRIEGQIGDQFVSQLIPIRIHRRGPRVGEGEARQVGR